jgi:hypothetical protein
MVEMLGQRQRRRGRHDLRSHQAGQLLPHPVNRLLLEHAFSS